MTALYTYPARRSSRPLALLAGLLLAAQAALAAGTPIYSAGGAAGARVIQTCTTLGTVTTCFGDVDNKEQAADGDFASAATIRMPLVALGQGGSVRLRLDLSREAPKNYRAGVVVRRNGRLLTLLGLNLLGALEIRTLKKDGANSQIQESVRVRAALAQLALADEDAPIRLEFTATKPFDQIELEASSLASVGYQLDVLYAYAIDANVLETTTGYVSRFASPTTANYSTAVTDDNGVTLCVNVGVSNPLRAVDDDLENYATLGTLASLSCPITLQTQLEGTAPAGYEAGFLLGSADLLDVGVLNGLRLTTYQGNVRQEQAAGRGPLRLQVLPNNQYVVRFATTKPFDRVELRRTSLLSALDDVRLYYGFGVTPSTFRDQQPRLSAFAVPTGNFQVGGATILINNPARAADQDLTTNYATVGNLLSVLAAPPRLKLRLNGPGKAGNLTGVVLGLGTAVLDADVLRNIRLSTYSGANGGTLVETASGGELLNLELLADGRREISFLTTQDFDWVEVELATGVAVLSNTRIYYAFAEDRPTGFPARIVVPGGTLPVQLIAFGARTSGLAVEVTWETATELNSQYFEVQRSVDAGRGFGAVGQRPAVGSSRTRQRYALTDAAAAQVAAGVLYYRLRQVDLDGTEAYSSVVVVTRQLSVGPLTFYPNPASVGGKLRIGGLPNLPTGSYELHLYSSQGTLVSRQPLPDWAPEVETVVPQLAAGLYQAVVHDAAGHPVGRQRLAVDGER